MSPTEFWRLIDTAVQSADDVDRRIVTIMQDLGEADDAFIAGFRDQLDSCLAQACRRDIYAAGVLLTGRSFDDERFEAFRCLLLLKGRQAFENALREPDTLADVHFTKEEKELDFQSDMLLFAPGFAYQERHGEDADLEEDFPAAHIEVAPVTFEYNKEELMREFPRLWPKRRAMVEPKSMTE